MIFQIKEVPIETSPCIGIKICFFFQALNHILNRSIHPLRQAVVAQAVVIQVHQTQHTAGFNQTTEVCNQFSGSAAVELQYKTCPDEIEESQRGQISEKILLLKNQVVLLVTISRMLNPITRKIDTNHLSCRLHGIIQEVRGQTGPAANVGNTHAGGNAGPLRLLKHRLRIGLEFKTLNLLSIFHNIIEKVSCHGGGMLAMKWRECNGIETKHRWV